MTLIRVDQVRAALIANIKANANIMLLLSDANEVRESNWKGMDYSYPNYRVRINSILPVDECYQKLDASILCFSEQASSQEAEEMAGVLANEYHGSSFTQAGIHFGQIITNTIPAIAQTLTLWRSEVNLQTIVN